MKLFKHLTLKVLSVLPILVLSFSAQAALSVNEYDLLSQDKNLLGKSLFIDGIEYNLNQVLNASASEFVGEVSVGFILENKEDILNGKVEGILIDKQINIARSGSVVSER